MKNIRYQLFNPLRIYYDDCYLRYKFSFNKDIFEELFVSFERIILNSQHTITSCDL